MASLDEETAKKVIRQVEFYFSDSNLPKDIFLMKAVADSEDGLVSLALICSFSRMRNHLGLGDAKPEDVSEDTVKAVAEILRTSSFLKVSEDGTKVGRTTKLLKPEEVIEQLDDRSLAASPLEYNIKLEDVESFFGQFAKVNSVRLPRHIADKRLFCGTALIEFSTKEDAENVFKQSLVYAGVELELKPKKDFDAERAKLAEIVEDTRFQVNSNSQSQVDSNHKNISNAEADYPKGLIVAFMLNSKSTGGSTEQNGKAGAEPASTENDVKEADETLTEDAKDDETNLVEKIEEESGENVEEKSSLEGEVKETEDEKKSFDSPTLKGEVKEAEGEENSFDSPIQKDEDKPRGEENSATAKYKDNMDVVLREDLKSVFQKFGTVMYVDFKMGSGSGYIRFEEADASQKARAAAVLAEEGGLVVKNYIATLDPVVGDAEREYWSMLRAGRQGRCQEYKGNRGRGAKRNRGGRQNGGKHSRHRENDSSGRPNKFRKVGAF